jgi:hypothetical protein
MSGRLTDSAELVAAANCFWDGIKAWAAERGLTIVQDFSTLLARQPFTP